MKIKLLHIWIIFLSSCFVFSQTKFNTGEQSNAGGKIESSTNSASIIGIMGQPSPAGTATGSGTFLYSGFIPNVTAGVADGDTSAPLAPSSLTANPSGWSQENRFTLTWTNPAGDTTIAGARYKIGSAPTGNLDGIYMVGNAITHLENIQVSAAGTFSVYVWLRDEAGNTNFENNASTTLKFDNINPQLATHIPVTEASANQAVEITASATDAHSGINMLKLFYRKAGAVGTMDSVNYSGNSASIPASIHTQRGSEYYLKVYDNAGNYDREPQNGLFLVQARVNASTGASNSVAQHNGTTVNDYRLFSVPIVLDNKTPQALLEDDLGGYDEAKWKFFRITNDVLQEYNAFKDQPVIQPGRGFLILVKDGGKVIDTGSGLSTDESHTQVNLSTGWNIIGNPFDFDIPLDSLKINGAPVTGAWYLSNSGWIQNPPFLKKWEGLAIDASGVSTLNIGLASGEGSDFSISDFFADEWGFRLSAYGEANSDIDNFVGVYADNSKLSRTTWREPFAIGASTSLSIKNDGAEGLSKSGSSNLASYLQEKNQTGNSWDLEVTGYNVGEKIVIDFEMFGNLPGGFSAQLIDKNLKTMYNLEEINYALDLTMGSSGKRDFRMVVGDEAFVESQSRDFVIPDMFDLQQNYPNPFNPSTNILYALPVENSITLEIYNILGQKVKTLLHNQKVDAGFHTTLWNGTNDLGNQVSSGVYIIKLKGENTVKIRKAVLIR